MDALSLVLVSALWGGYFVVGRLAVGASPPLMVASWRFLLAGAAFVVLAVPVLRKGLRWDARAALGLFAMSATGVFAYNWLVFEGVRRAGASDAALITPSTHPILTMLVAAFLFREPITRRRLAGLGLAVVGQLLVFEPVLAHPIAGSGRLLGDLCDLGGAACWSAFTLIGRAVGPRATPFTVAALTSILGGLMLAAVAAPQGQLVPPVLADPFWPRVWYLALGGTVVATLLYQRGVARLGAAKAASFSYLVPVFALAMAVLFLHERPEAAQLAGMAAVLVGVTVANTGRRSPAVAAAPPPVEA